MRSRANIASHPIHPMLVSLPIGLWVGALVLSIVSVITAEPLFAAAGFYAMLGGCIGAVMAAVPGVIDLFGTVPERSSARQRGYVHGSVNTFVLLVFIYAAWRQGSPIALPDKFTIVAEWIGVLAIGYSGWLGGTLVYRNQIGVNRLYANAGQLKERTVEGFDHPVCNQGELGEGQAMLVHIGTERIAVARCSEGIVAFSDHCTHKGGPLSDGAIVGCAVQCPWHGSQFDIRTGRVIAGPAEEHLRTYAVEIRAGEVYVRRDRLMPERKTA